VELKWMTSADVEAVEEACDLFDHDVRRDWIKAFLDDPAHLLCIAYEDGRPAGFVSGVEMIHPDKGAEMFLYELGVAEAFRGSGIGKALTKALVDLAVQRGCYGMWVLTDDTNEAALRTYRGGGATETERSVLLTWKLDPTHITFTSEDD
jgi:ribosomal protein S18 acetylase RimI-like enzyme